MSEPLKITPDILAPIGKRFLNYCIDIVICSCITLGIAYIGNSIYSTYGYEGFAIGSNYFSLRFNLLTIVIRITYYGMFETLTARTPGKYITGTKVIYQDGTFPESGTVLIRSLCRQIPFEPFSFLGILPVGWHDRFSKTIVVDVKAFEKKQLDYNSVRDIKATDNNK